MDAAIYTVLGGCILALFNWLLKQYEEYQRRRVTIATTKTAVKDEKNVTIAGKELDNAEHWRRELLTEYRAEQARNTALEQQVIDLNKQLAHCEAERKYLAMLAGKSTGLTGNANG